MYSIRLNVQGTVRLEVCVEVLCVRLCIDFDETLERDQVIAGCDLVTHITTLTLFIGVVKCFFRLGFRSNYTVCVRRFQDSHGLTRRFLDAIPQEGRIDLVRFRYTTVLEVGGAANVCNVATFLEETGAVFVREQEHDQVLALQSAGSAEVLIHVGVLCQLCRVDQVGRIVHDERTIDLYFELLVVWVVRDDDAYQIGEGSPFRIIQVHQSLQLFLVVKGDNHFVRPVIFATLQLVFP